MWGFLGLSIAINQMEVGHDEEDIRVVITVIRLPFEIGFPLAFDGFF